MNLRKPTRIFSNILLLVPVIVLMAPIYYTDKLVDLLNKTKDFDKEKDDATQWVIVISGVIIQAIWTILLIAITTNLSK